MTTPTPDQTAKAEAIARECAHRSGELRFPYAYQANSRRVYEEETTKLLSSLLVPLLLSYEAECDRLRKAIDNTLIHIDPIPPVNQTWQEALKRIEVVSDQLRSQLALANDAAAKGETGRNLGTALEEAVKENAELRAERDELVKLAGDEWGAGYQQFKDLQIKHQELTERLAKLAQPEKQIKDWVFNANELQKDNNKLRAERDELQQQVELERKKRQLSSTAMLPAQQKYYDGKPGWYYCKCLGCERIFYGDKRDLTCPECEIKALRTREAALIAVARAATRLPNVSRPSPSPFADSLRSCLRNEN